MDTAEGVGKSGDDLAASIGRLMAMTEADLDKWLAAYKGNWKLRELALFAGLLTEDCAYRDTPFMEQCRDPSLPPSGGLSRSCRAISTSNSRS
jgi:hypothetical protein